MANATANATVTTTASTSANADAHENDFQNTGRVGRRNALPDILNEDGTTTIADLPDKLDALSIKNPNESAASRNASTSGTTSQHAVNGGSNHWNYQDKIDMTVPDRIVVMGQDQHLGTRSAPREIVLDNSILPPDPSHVRVSTPPRVITLSEHHFPSASDEREGDTKRDFELQSPSSDDRRLTVARPRKTFGNDYLNQIRETTPPLGPSGELLSSSEEEVFTASTASGKVKQTCTVRRIGQYSATAEGQNSLLHRIGLFSDESHRLAE